MSDTAHAAAAHHGHGHTNYVKIWGILLGLLVVSVVGPLIGLALEEKGAINHVVRMGMTLSMAFGIAVVKAYMVAKYFMHINLEKKYVMYLLFTMLAITLVFVGGTAPDVLEHQGAHWVNKAAQDHVDAGLKQAAEEDARGGHGAPGAKAPSTGAHP